MSTRLTVPHGDHEHSFDFGVVADAPPVRQVRCGECGRSLGRVHLDHSGAAALLAGIGPASGGGGTVRQIFPETGRVLHARAATWQDLSEAGWDGANEPDRYLVTCRGRNGHVMSRRVTRQRLTSLYLDAICAGAGAVIVE